MSQMKHFAYMEGDGFQALEMPYRGDLSMVVFLPSDHKGLACVRAIFDRRKPFKLVEFASEE